MREARALHQQRLRLGDIVLSRARRRHGGCSSCSRSSRRRSSSSGRPGRRSATTARFSFLDSSRWAPSEAAGRRPGIRTRTACCSSSTARCSRPSSRCCSRYRWPSGSRSTSPMSRRCACASRSRTWSTCSRRCRASSTASGASSPCCRCCTRSPTTSSSWLGGIPGHRRRLRRPVLRAVLLRRRDRALDHGPADHHGHLP